jgi:L-amino acid N-acyltransferase YncA
MSPSYEHDVTLLIRPGRPDDAAAVVAVRNHAIEHTAAIWTTELLTPDQGAAWWGALLERGAALVAEEAGGEVVGHAFHAPWRPKEGYRHTVESSVYVRADRVGRGIGDRLMRELVARAREAGHHVMIADIEAGNLASVRLHERLGFEHVGTVREVGRKFDRWLDLAVLRLPLS